MIFPFIDLKKRCVQFDSILIFVTTQGPLIWPFLTRKSSLLKLQLAWVVAIFISEHWKLAHNVFFWSMNGNILMCTQSEMEPLKRDSLMNSGFSCRQFVLVKSWCNIFLYIKPIYSDQKLVAWKYDSSSSLPLWAWWGWRAGSTGPGKWGWTWT